MAERGECEQGRVFFGTLCSRKNLHGWPKKASLLAFWLREIWLVFLLVFHLLGGIFLVLDKPAVREFFCVFSCFFYLLGWFS